MRQAEFTQDHLLPPDLTALAGSTTDNNGGVMFVVFGDENDAPIMPIPGPQGTAGTPGIGLDGPSGSAGSMGPPGLSGVDAEDPFFIPGAQGNPGTAGATGATGPAGPPLPGFDGEHGLDAPIIPGPTGATGDVGPPGRAGEDGEDAFFLPGPQGATGATGATGASAANVMEVEIDVGSTPVSEARIAAAVTGALSTSKFIGGVAYKAPTGKDLDELEMDALEVKFEPSLFISNQVFIHIKGLEGYIADTFIIWLAFA
jgi:hypothetical protein